MSDINNQLKEALVEALEELFNAEDAAHAENLIKLIEEIRSDLNIIMMADKYVENNVWSRLRKTTSNVQTLMATTATFVQGIDDIDGAISKYVRAFVPFTNKTLIVDDETIQKAVEPAELEKTLKDNYWLFFMLFAATNLRIVNLYLKSILPSPKAKT